METLLEDMDGIMEKSRQVTRADWEHRPLLHRVLGGLLRPFAMWINIKSPAFFDKRYSLPRA